MNMTVSIVALASLVLLTPAVLAQTPPAETASARLSSSEELGAPKDVIMLRLRDGSIRWGEILEHDPDGIQFGLLANGGRVRLPWSLMDPPQEEALRERFGYVDVSSEELMIDAISIQLRGGGEVIGVIQSREGDNLIVKTGGNLQAIPKLRVQSISQGLRIPALDVYSRDEIYAQNLANTALDDPEAHFELARLCERILDFRRAAEHFAAAAELDPEFNPEEVAFALQLAQVKAEQQGQIDYLHQVDTLRKRKRFDEALLALEEFEALFPKSPLYEDVNKKKSRILKARDKAILDLVEKRWHYWLRRLARAAALEYTTYAEAVGYAEEGLPQEIRDHVLADVRKQLSEEVQPDHIMTFWANRSARRYVFASYGLGTWLLGEDQARAGIEDKDVAAPEVSAKYQERAAFEAKIKRFLKNQELARKARSRTDEAEDYDRFWSTFPVNGRAQWIRAFYAEHVGDVELKPKPRFQNCVTCAGSGAVEVMYVGGGGTGSGGTTLHKCPLCHGVGVVRKIFYR